QTLDKINKDLKEISNFDPVATHREKAKLIICNWKKLNNCLLFGHELFVPAKPYTASRSEDNKMQGLIAERNILMAQQQNEVIKTSVVRDKMVRTALARQLENFESERTQASNDLERFKDKNYENSNENVMSNLKEKPQQSITFLPKKRAHNTLQESEKNITDEDLVNSVNDTSDTFGQVKFPSFYSKLKTTWGNQDVTNYHVIDLGDKDTLCQVHDLLDEDELKLLFRRLVLDDEDIHINEKTHKYIELFDQIIDEENKENIHDDTVVDEVTESNLLDKNNEETKYTEGDNENFDKSIAKMKEIMHQLDNLSEKYHYLSNTFPITAQNYDQIKMPDMFIIKSIASR
ncbi:17397_t:CDS:2, partial [Dentiscutata heterogama]